MKYVVTLNGKNYEVDVTKTDAVITSISPAACVTPTTPAVPVVETPAASTAVSVEGTKVISPMPGNILAVNFTAGQTVKAGDVLFILEAMKMENEIVAPLSGTIKQVLVSKGSVVETDAILAVI